MAPLPEGILGVARTRMKLDRRRRIRLGMERTAWSYGKLGLLIDDQADAASRVARELYAADTLPAWWWIASSMECACHALAAFIEIFDKPELKASLLGLVIIDRYLPITCGPGGSRRPIAWDQPPGESEESPWRRRLVELIRPLVAPHDTGRRPAKPAPVNSRFDLKYVTSYPYARARRPKPRAGESSESSGELRISWEIRSIELLPQYRRQLSEEWGWEPLLSYGPEDDAPIVSSTPPPEDVLQGKELDKAWWKARAWWTCIRALADQLHQWDSERPLPVILFTGAGASLMTGAYGAGMPEAWQLLQRACREVERKKNEVAEGSERWPPPLRAACACNRGELRFERKKRKRQRWEKIENGPTPVQWLLEQAKDIQSLDWRLEELFNPLDHGEHDKKFLQFHRSFRDALYRCDHGFVYHHWLMARMPWSAILTTNFDAFHERSAAAAAQILWLDDDRRSRCLQLGSTVPDWPQVPRVKLALDLLEAAGRLLDEGAREKVSGAIQLVQARIGEPEPALFKPYGSLYSPTGDIALSVQEMGGFQGRFHEALAGALRGEEGGALVVIGHSMRDEFISAVLGDGEIQNKLEKMQIIWVDPMAFERCSEASESAGEGKVWEDLLWRRKTRLHAKLKQKSTFGKKRSFDFAACSGPLPGTALEFLYDLWIAFQRKRKPR